MPFIQTRSLTRLAIVAVLGLSGCGGTSEGRATVDSASPSLLPVSPTVSIKGFKFTPASQSVPAGSTVTWTNDEDSLHTVTAGSPGDPSRLFDSGEIDTGEEFTFTFANSGQYPFFCARHDFMTGDITVTP